MIRKLIRILKITLFGFIPSKWIFTKIYDDNLWGNAESRSGPGSSLKQTFIVRKELINLIEERSINSLLDIPCGDFNWLSKENFSIKYTGADIVSEIIKNNNLKYSSKNINFIELDIIYDFIPNAYLILCRDLLVHFNNKQIQKSLRNIQKSKAKYLLVTTFPGIKENFNIITGEWRPIDLTQPPFNFPSPVKIIEEGCEESNYHGHKKCLGLWKIQDIKV